MGCLTGIAKYLLFFFNFLIVVCGIAIIAIGSIVLVNEDKGIDRVTDFSVGGFAIAVGVIIFIIAFFGCCGAIKENNCMLTTYAVILILLLILQVVLGALAFVSIKNDNGELKEKVEKAMENVFDKYSSDNEDKKKIVDDIQQSFECCGVVGPDYWTHSSPFVPPESCYENKDLSKTLYTTGCAKKFQNVITENIKAIGGVAIAFAVVELVGAIFACMVKK